MNTEDQNDSSFALGFLFGFVLLLVILLLSACSGTVRPDVVDAPAPSWVGDKQDSGVEVVHGVGEWAPDTRAYYNDLIVRYCYGARFSPAMTADQGVTPGAPNGWYYANHFARTHLFVMSKWRRSAMHQAQKAGGT